MYDMFIAIHFHVTKQLWISAKLVEQCRTLDRMMTRVS